MPPDFAFDIDEAFGCIRAFAADAPEAARDQEALAGHLYTHWFQSAGEVRAWPAHGVYLAETTAGRNCESGWHITGFAPSGILAKHEDGRTGVIPPGLFVPDDARSIPHQGMTFRRLKVSGAPIDGFWHLWSDAWRAVSDRGRLVRIYLPLAQDTGPEAARMLAATAPDSVLWAAKFLAGPHSAGRRDAGLIYLPAVARHEPWLAGFLEEAAALLTGPRIRLTAPFGKAWLAYDPGNDQSFGQMCCGLLAETAWHRSRLRSRRSFSAAATAKLAEAAPHMAEEIAS